MKSKARGRRPRDVCDAPLATLVNTIRAVVTDPLTTDDPAFQLGRVRELLTHYDSPWEELPPEARPLAMLGLSPKTYEALERAGVATAGGLAALGVDFVYAARGCGSGAVRECIAALGQLGLRFEKAALPKRV